MVNWRSNLAKVLHRPSRQAGLLDRRPSQVTKICVSLLTGRLDVLDLQLLSRSQSHSCPVWLAKSGIAKLRAPSYLPREGALFAALAGRVFVEQSVWPSFDTVKER